MWCYEPIPGCFFWGILWWSWQSWRASRITLHLKHLHFWKHHSTYALKAQVIVPRILGMVPSLIAAHAIYLAKGYVSSLTILFINVAVWIYVFFHFRKDLIILLRGKVRWLNFAIPDYVLNKNEAYTGAFIWEKHWKWIFIRITVVAFVFLMVLYDPVAFPQQIGAAGLVASALGSWLVITSLVNLLEVRFSFPLGFTLIVFALAFSFFNNNHEMVWSENTDMNRPDLDVYFDQWVNERIPENGDSLSVFLVSAEGGGIRSAYWTANVLTQITNLYPEFVNRTFFMNGISGGALGIATYQAGKMN